MIHHPIVWWLGAHIMDFGLTILNFGVWISGFAFS